MPPADQGQWSDLLRAPGDHKVIDDKVGVYAVHGAVLHTGKVLLWSGRLEGAQALYQGWVWEPGDPGPPGSITTPEQENAFVADAEPAPFDNTDPTEPDDWLVDGEAGPGFVPGRDLFCAHQCQLEDGKILVTGGASANKPGDASGLPAVYTFDPEAPAPGAGETYREYWKKHPNMTHGRWYPTNVMLPDGRVAVFSGRPNRAKDKDRDGNPESGMSPRVEVIAAPDYDPVDLGAEADRDLYIYPGLHLVRGGRIFYTGTSWAQSGPALRTAAFEMTGPWSGRWVDFEQPGIPGSPLRPNFPERQEGMSVVAPPAEEGKLLLVGGSRRAPDEQATDDDGNLLWHVEGTEIRFATDPDTGEVVWVRDEGTDVAGGGTVVGEGDHGEVEGGTGALEGVTHVESVMTYSGITPASNPAAIEMLHTRPDPDGDPSAVPVWEYLGDLNVGPGGPEGSVGRANVHLVVLPDGQVCVIGGKWDHKNAPHGSVYEAEILDPATGTSTTMASQNVHRGYHSVALLLPDARILVAGSGNTMEFFSPPYLFREPDVPRLTIGEVSVPDGPDRHSHYGGRVHAEVSDADGIRQVVLVRPGAVTHHTDSDQRLVPVGWTRARAGRDVEGDLIEIHMPTDASIAPPGYYMVFLIDEHDRPCERGEFIRLTHRKCTIINNRSTIGRDEASTILDDAEGPVIEDALYVHVDGFLPGELGIGDTLPEGAAIDALAPDIDLLGASQLRLEPRAIIPEMTDLDPRLRQRFTFAYNLRILGLNDFPDAETGTDRELVDVTFDVEGHRCRSQLRLIDQPNPYMLDGPTEWLSVDLRVFRVKDGQSQFGRTVSGDPNGYILAVIDDIDQSDFEDLQTEQDRSRLNIATHEDGERVWNFAIAQVRYRGSTGNDAEGVRCFFRMFQTAVANLAFDPDRTYQRHTAEDGTQRPLLGHLDGEVVTIPFFAHPRSDDMRDQTVVSRRLEGTGDEYVAYFGAWLDINVPDDLRFPEHIDPEDPGPYSAGPGSPLRSIQQLVVRGAHQCLVAEIAFGDLIDPGDTPASSDKLSQRNLAYLPADNPGDPLTRTVHHTFDLAPAVAPEAQLQGFATALMVGPQTIWKARNWAADELQIFWDGVPAGSEVELFMPNAELAAMLEFHRLRPSPEVFQAPGGAILRFAADGATHLPLMRRDPGNIAGLMTIRLPDGITAGEQYHVVARHIDGRTRTVQGAFEFAVPVAKRDQIIDRLANIYAVLKWVQPTIAPTSRWHEVFDAYVEGFERRLRSLGVWPDDVEASPAGVGLRRPTRPPEPGREPREPGKPSLLPSGRYRSWSGVVRTLVYDCFGHFEGFVLDCCPGERHFFTSDPGVHRVVRRAFREHTPVTVFAHPNEPRRPFKICVGAHLW